MDQKPGPQPRGQPRTQAPLPVVPEELTADLRKANKRLNALVPLLIELRDLARVVVWCFVLGYAGLILWLVVGGIRALTGR